MKKMRVVSVILTLVMMMTVLPTAVSANFSDMAGTESEKVIARWYEAGLISGYPDGTFKPNEKITRAQFAKIIADLFVLENTENTFTDVPEDAWYGDYIQKASAYIPCCEADENGVCEKIFSPDAPIDMAQVADTLSKLTKIDEETKENAKGEATREDLILFIDTLLGGENGFFYMVSVIDSHTAEDTEIKPLVALTEGSELVTRNDKGQVLLLSWHSYPESYIPGEQFTCKYGEMWTFTDKEILAWYDENGETVTDWELRMEQLLGLPETDKKTHVSAFWVDPEEIIRPAFQPDAKQQVTKEDLDGSSLGEHKDWFDENTVYSYETSAYPWTRLGYTYDWFLDDNEYGLTEFLILYNSVIDVEWTKSFDEFVAWMAEN